MKESGEGRQVDLFIYYHWCSLNTKCYHWLKKANPDMPGFFSYLKNVQTKQKIYNYCSLLPNRSYQFSPKLYFIPKTRQYRHLAYHWQLGFQCQSAKWWKRRKNSARPTLLLCQSADHLFWLGLLTAISFDFLKVFF